GSSSSTYSTSSTSSTSSTTSASTTSSTFRRAGASRGTVTALLQAGQRPCLPASSSLTFNSAPHFGHLNLMAMTGTPVRWDALRSVRGLSVKDESGWATLWQRTRRISLPGFCSACESTSLSYPPCHLVSRQGL